MRTKFCFSAALASVASIASSGAAASALPQREVTGQAASKQVYTVADFARFAPKTAYDMLAQVPGFTIRSADQERGLGQASENVLIDGQRIANKSGGAIDQLQHVPAANVQRIEIVDATRIGIAGLTGQVANVVLNQVQKGSGEFEYDPNWRAHYAKAEFVGGSVSYTGKSGPVNYALSAKNEPERGAFGGPVWIYGGGRELVETRHEVHHAEYDEANVQAALALDGSGASLANLTFSYTPYWNPGHTRERRIELATGEERGREFVSRRNGYKADLSGDYQFELGPGRLKLMGLRHWEHEPLQQDLITTFPTSGADAQGTRFDRDTHIGETIARLEYSGQVGNNNWQISLERAFNSLHQRGRLFSLDQQGNFEEVPFPGGTGRVTEVRYESIGTWSRPVTHKLDIQVAIGGELSWLTRIDKDHLTREFFRPKGSVNVGWRPSRAWDLSFKLRRRVGQISFYDFLAQPDLTQDRENAGNPELVPPQSWELESDVARDLGPWGRSSLNFHYHRVQDIVDFIPIGDDGEGVGNLPSASRFGFESTNTLNLDPLGWIGAKLNLNFGREWTAVKDPLTGQTRPISDVRTRWLEARVRHDVPGTQIAWSVYVAYSSNAPVYLLKEVDRTLNMPWDAGFYIENKNIRGFDVRFSAENVLGGVLEGRYKHWRSVYDGYRDRSPLAFFEKGDQRIGPIFDISIKGTF